VSLSTESLARSAALHPWRTIIIWLIPIIIGIVLTVRLLESATTEGQGDFTNNPEAKRATELLEDSGLRGEPRDTEIVVIKKPGLNADTPEFVAKINAVHAAIVALGTKVVEDPEAVPNPTQLPAEASGNFYSVARDAVFIPITLAGDVLEAADTVDGLLALADEQTADGYTVGVAGAAAIGADFREVSESDLVVGEAIGVGAALIILLLVFRAFGSVWIPVVLSILSIGLTFATISVIGQFYENFPFFVTNFVTMIGLAVGIDYTLFIVARFKEERARGRDKLDAIAFSASTASRAVLFSGFTVVFALVGMLIVPTTIFFAMALGAIIVVIFTVLLALIFLPALLSLLGDKVNGWPVPFLSKAHDYDDTEHGFWNWITRIVLKRPIIFAVATFALLVLLVVPYLNINLGFNGVETLPDSFRARQTFDILLNEFPEGALADVSSVDIVIDGNADSEATAAAIQRLLASIADDPAFGEAEQLQIAGSGVSSVGVLPIALGVAGDSDEANKFVRELRAGYIPDADFSQDVLVGGITAFNVDFFNLVDVWTPIVIAVVLALSFVLLMIVFRSLIVPIKAIILNLLSVGAAYGLLVLVFQEGWATNILGYQQVPTIEAWIPLFLFAVLFGLSMDYEVFLLSRIRERYDVTGDNDESVAFGLRSTAAIITGAALIMVSVFAGFTLGDLVMFQQFGFGLGVAILVDATIIRSILVPSTMKLLGNANWYLPQFLRWLPDLRVEGGEAPHVARSVPAEGD
jgi:RND superfamily putative drug exporter